MLCWISAAAAQTGVIALLCEDPTSPTEKVAFQIDYDRRAIIPAHTMMEFHDERISWTDRSGMDLSRNNFSLNRRTGVLTRIKVDINTRYTYNCQQVEQTRRF